MTMTNGHERLEVEDPKPKGRRVTPLRALLAMISLGVFAVLTTAIVAACVVLFRWIVAR